jgi:hypothetical protein
MSTKLLVLGSRTRKVAAGEPGVGMQPVETEMQDSREEPGRKAREDLEEAIRSSSRQFYHLCSG